MKPSGLSRGRGIDVFNQLCEILDYGRGKETQWVVQKYIENPLIVCERKFDIRVWVLVSDNDPLTIWFWNRPYVRFPAADYDDTNLNDRYVHLTNNSVAKNSKNRKFIGDGNMWFSEELEDYLQERYGRNVWEEEVVPKMKQLVKNSLLCTGASLSDQKGCFELFGYDILIDNNFNPWLIEINSSPTMESSTVSAPILILLGRHH